MNIACVLVPVEEQQGGKSMDLWLMAPIASEMTENDFYARKNQIKKVNSSKDSRSNKYLVKEYIRGVENIYRRIWLILTTAYLTTPMMIQ